MRGWFIVAGLALLGAFGQPGRCAADAPRLFAAFDAGALSGAEKRLLQAALAAVGDYDGPLDGAWGRVSQRGIEAYAAREFATAPLRLHAGALAIALADEVALRGWEAVDIPDLGLSLALPLASLERDETQAGGESWRGRDGNLTILTLRQTARAAADWHRAGVTAPAEGLYTLRQPDRMITSSVTVEGWRVYQRSDRVAGGWSTVRILGGPEQARLVGLIGSSIHPGHAEPWGLPEGGALARIVEETFALLAKTAPHAEATLVAAPPSAGEPAREEEIGTGTGFYLGAHLLVTAAHVIGGCETVALVDGTPLTLVAMDADLDVAALRAPVAAPAWLRLGSGADLRLGQRIHALGYPYFGLSGTSLNATGGNVSALAGMDDDRRFVSISAPVQPGNSGGPLLDGAGNVAGMVIARLSDDYISETTGTLPENVNFALNGADLAEFLRRDGLRPEDDALPAFAMDDGAPPEISSAVVPLICY